MFSLSIALGSITWQLLYNKEEDANKAYDELAVCDTIVLIDDFGQRFRAERTDVHGCLLEDMDKSALARIELGLHNMRMQIKGGQMADNDPAIKEARRRQSMGVISPMGPGAGIPSFGPNGRMS